MNPFMIGAAISGEVSSGGVSAVVDAANEGVTLMGNIINAITAQPILLFYLGCGLIPIGIALFVKFKRGAKA